jgi:hypothetical protein
MEDDNLEDLPNAELFMIQGDEPEAFDLPRGSWFMLREDSQGFIYGSVHTTRGDAEAKFKSWLGL